MLATTGPVRGMGGTGGMADEAAPATAPRLGQHTDAVLAELAGPT